ncbi:MAG TPA: hypothetical protein PKN33_11570 [Phycisphaerae bacterium]|nr:hypothetical protein [Phycisphaerae bacterium]
MSGKSRMRVRICTVAPWLVFTLALVSGIVWIAGDVFGVYWCNGVWGVYDDARDVITCDCGPYCEAKLVDLPIATRGRSFAPDGIRIRFLGRVSIRPWIPLIAFAILAFILWRLRRFAGGHCQQCGYDLTGNESGVCPECGTASDHSTLKP